MTGFAKLLPFAGLCVGCFAVVLQFFLTAPLRMENGNSFPEAVVFFFSFFTILTNIGAILVYAAYFWPKRLPMMARPASRAAIAVAITVVGLVYAFVLAKIWSPQGLFWLSDMLLHYAAPVIYVLWWLFSGRGGTLSWSDAPRMLIFPVAYLVYAMSRGALTGLYPYPFLDAGALGSGKAFANAGLVAALFFALSLAAVALDRSFRPLRS